MNMQFPFQDPARSPQERVSDLLSRLTLDEKLGLLSTHQLPVERLGIGEWYIGQEIARGLVMREEENPTTVFPQPLGMAASFDRGMMEEIGTVAARESRAYYNEKKNGGLMVWGPTVDLCRDPRWGRTEECYGEDPFLTGEMSIAYTKGLRGDGPVSATIPTLKHFCANSHEEGRATDNANLDPRLKHEYYYAAFRAPIMRGGAGSIMTAYNEICHAPAVMNHDLKNVLKKQWGLGFVVTDGGDFSQNVTAHGTFSSHAEALRACLYAGADCMTDGDALVREAAENALARGLISEADIDLAVGNILKSRVELGHFDPATPYDTLTRQDVNTPEDRALNLRAARENMILLENDGLLPLSKDSCGRIGLFGPNHDCNLLDWYTGTSSYQISVKEGLLRAGCDLVCDTGWDIVQIQAPDGSFLVIGENGTLRAGGSAEEGAQLYLCRHDGADRWVNLQDVRTGRIVHIENDVPALGNTTVYGWFTSETLHLDTHSLTGAEVISDYLHGKQLCQDGDGRLFFRKKARPDSSVMFRIRTVSQGCERLMELAKECGTVIYCGGNDPEQVARECYDRRTIDLPPVQQEALTQLADGCGRLVLMLVSGYPYALHFSGKRPGAILHTTHAGPELGTAAAQTLFGENNPAGRCPVTWYACDEDLADLRDYNIMKNKMTYLWFDGTPLYPFGHGLSYSRFEYAGLKTEVTKAGIAVEMTVTNVSRTDGDEVVQLYISPVDSPLPRPRIRLCGFERLSIPAGETVRYTGLIPFRELEIYDVERRALCCLAGTYRILAGASSEDIRLESTVQVPGVELMPRSFLKPVPAEMYDGEENTEIFTDPLTGETHVRGLAWSNMLFYRDADLTGCRELILRAAAPAGPVSVSVELNGKPVGEVTVPPGDGYTDFRICTLPVSGRGDLILRFGQDACIESIQAH